MFAWELDGFDVFGCKLDMMHSFHLNKAVAMLSFSINLKFCGQHGEGNLGGLGKNVLVVFGEWHTMKVAGWINA